MIYWTLDFLPYINKNIRRTLLWWGGILLIINLILFLSYSFDNDLNFLGKPLSYLLSGLLTINVAIFVYLVISKAFANYLNNYFSSKKINNLIIKYDILKKEDYISYIWEYFLLNRNQHLSYNATMGDLYQLVFLRKFESLEILHQLTEEILPGLFEKVALPYYQNGIIADCFIHSRKDLFDFYFRVNQYKFLTKDHQIIYENLEELEPEMIELLVGRLDTMPISLANFIFSKINLRYLFSHNPSIEKLTNEIKTLQEKALINNNLNKPELESKLNKI